MRATAEQTICDFAEKDLMLQFEDTRMIPRTAQLRHCLEVYERLSWHRAKRLVQNGQNPFENVLRDGKKFWIEKNMNFFMKP